MIHIRKKKKIHTIFWHLEICIGRYTSEIRNGQSWSNYIGPKRDISQVCLTRPVFTHFFLKVAWSGISLIVIHCPFCPGLTFESVFHLLVLGLNGPYSKAVVNVEEPASNIDYIR